MPFKEYPSIEYVRQCLREEGGRLFWLVRPREHFISDRTWRGWNTQNSLKEAGSLTGHGRKQRWKIGLDFRLFRRHVIIWAFHYGEWRLGIDHKDRNSLNDCIENLRVANQSQNIANSTIYSTNRSGFKGVFWDKRRQTWIASIKVDYRGRYLGRFDDPEEAHEAYMDAARKYFGEFACDGTPDQTVKVNL